MSQPSVLLIDDDAGVREALRAALSARGFRVRAAASCAEAEEEFRAAPPALALLDYRLDDGTALDLLPRLRAIDDSVPVVILTAHGSIDLAVRAIKEGAEQFLTKPVEIPALLVVMERALENRRSRMKELAGRSREERSAVDPFLGRSRAIRTLAEQAARVAASGAVVLVTGETGSGKGVLASWIHRNGPRAAEAFVDLNCAGLAKDFLESELFGHEKGAFTGAAAAKPGLLEVADRGTVFLDEIGDLDPEVQPKLLKVIEERRFRRMGALRDRAVDIRLLAATHQDLPALVSAKRFRSDLFYRISAVPLRVPSLRERAEDVPLLAATLLERIAADLGAPGASLTPRALSVLSAHTWPGNVRELRNVLERAVLLSGRRAIDEGDLVFGLSSAASSAVSAAPASSAAPAAPTSRTLEEVEREHIEAVLREERGHVERAARRLGVPRSSLYDRLKRLAISVEHPD